MIAVQPSSASHFFWQAGIDMGGPAAADGGGNPYYAGLGTIFGGILCRKVKCGNPKARGYRACRNGDPPGAPRISRGQVGYAPSGALRTHGHVGIDGEDGEVVTGWKAEGAMMVRAEGRA